MLWWIVNVSYPALACTPVSNDVISGLTASILSPTSVRLSWNANPSICNYSITLKDPYNVTFYSTFVGAGTSATIAARFVQGQNNFAVRGVANNMFFTPYNVSVTFDFPTLCHSGLPCSSTRQCKNSTTPLFDCGPCSPTDLCRIPSEWTRIKGGPGNDNGEGVAVDLLGYVYVSGTSSKLRMMCNLLLP